MTVPDISPLFQPLTINGMTLPNRFVMPAMQRGWCVDGVPLPKMADYYRERVDGGVGLIVGESCTIDHPSASGQNPAAHLFGPAVPSWERCVRAVKDAGGHMFLQLWHEGSMRREGAGGPAGEALDVIGDAVRLRPAQRGGDQRFHQPLGTTVREHP